MGINDDKRAAAELQVLGQDIRMGEQVRLGYFCVIGDGVQSKMESALVMGASLEQVRSLARERLSAVMSSSKRRRLCAMG
ncbi:hypothetical protein [Paenibacillus sp. KS1]|uniref:hypothetical protein n=1 Tax=Paenibacillus sp. KS1 TaxID=1849249 RepID=UPI000AA19C6F|nr:hypothetical protein [Paenibacillus sp. KS1]